MILYFLPSIFVAALAVCFVAMALLCSDLFLIIFFSALALLALRVAWVEFKSELRLMKRMRT